GPGHSDAIDVLRRARLPGLSGIETQRRGTIHRKAGHAFAARINVEGKARLAAAADRAAIDALECLSLIPTFPKAIVADHHVRVARRSIDADAAGQSRPADLFPFASELRDHV